MTKPQHYKCPCCKNEVSIMHLEDILVICCRCHVPLFPDDKKIVTTKKNKSKRKGLNTTTTTHNYGNTEYDSKKS